MWGRIVAIGTISAAVALPAACTTQTRVVGEDVCAGYGLKIDSPEYRKCRAREGRSGAGHTPAELMTASRAACASYGIAPYTEQFERCARNEYAYRSQN